LAILLSWSVTTALTLCPRSPRHEHHRRADRCLPKCLRFLIAEQFDALAIPGSCPGFAVVCLGGVDGLPGLGGWQCALWSLRRQCRARFARPTRPDVLHPVLTPEITVMLKCLVPMKNNLRDR